MISDNKVYEPKSTTWNEIDSHWVMLHNGKMYLLPIVNRSIKYIPEWNEDGTVNLIRKDADELGVLVDKFMYCVTQSALGEVIFNLGAYSDFMNLVKTLIKRNYNFNQEEIVKLLTLTSDQLHYLVNNIIRHVRSY